MAAVAPALLLDVDGVLNVLSRSSLLAVLLDRDPGDVSSPERVSEHRVAADDGTVYTLRLRPEYGGWLRALRDTYELVWATTWGRIANERISPLLGLPDDLDVVPMPDAWGAQHEAGPEVCRKVPWIREWADRRGVEVLAWIDDETEDGDRHALTEGTSVRAALPLRADPFTGLDRDHLEALSAWAATGFRPDWLPPEPA